MTEPAQRDRVFETARLVLRRLSPGDAPFILELVNDPAWLRFIGDKGVRNLDDARGYIANGPADMYERLGFGLYCAERKTDGRPVGICGLIRRDGLDAVDLGFAFLPEFRKQGFAREAAAATLVHAREAFGFSRVLAITTPGNVDSIRLLESLGFADRGAVRLTPDAEEVRMLEFLETAPGAAR